MADALSHARTVYSAPPIRSATAPLAIAILLLIAVLPWAVMSRGSLFSVYLLQRQDLPILLGLPLLLLAVRLWTVPLRLPETMPRWPALLAAGAALVLLAGWGTHALMLDLAVSRDEHMVLFDMAVYAGGELATPLAPEWRDFARALVPAFLLNEDQPIGLVSDYLPVNALLRLAFAQLCDPAFYNPLLALLGGVALLDIARREFGDNAGAVWTTMLVYALSAQMLVNAMTTYAMTGHMVLNLLWLAAFLRGGRLGHGAAIAIGFLACGLHQLVFHPIFAAPFILWRLRAAGGWRLLLLYGGAYSAILGWWIGFPLLSALATGVAQQGADNSSLLDKLLPLLLRRDPHTVPLMLFNLLRFIAWQNLALLPLLIAAVPLAWRARSLAAPMLWGIGGLLLFVSVILPYQGHGWGYRYLHPFLGSFALLAGFGYRRLADQAPQRTQAMVATLSLATAVLAIPLLLVRAHEFIAPQAALDRYIAAQTGDFVVIDTEENLATSDGNWAPSAIDLVQNRPALDNRPLRFASQWLSDTNVRTLCARGQIRLIDKTAMHGVGFALNVPTKSPRFAEIAAIVKTGGCLVE